MPKKTVPLIEFSHAAGCEFQTPFAASRVDRANGITRALLARHHLRQSMSAAGYCYDNAFAESAFASLKSELLDDGAPFATKAAATTAVFDCLEAFDNRKRRHSSLGCQSPQAFLDSYFQNLKPSPN